jgi:imidazole glycerol-phosphate synthase subunit HisH
MSAPTVAIVDCQLGNMFSVERACETVGLRPVVTADPSVIESADSVILPGVGAFATAMDNLARTGVDDCLRAAVASGRPFLGICLGMQLLFTSSEEFGSRPGLDIIRGTVRCFAPSSEPRIRVPYIGWNAIRIPAGSSWAGTPLEDLRDGEEMYFVHSYYAEPADEDFVLCYSHYGSTPYCTGVAAGNVVAVQFHPEKSAARGLRIYDRFAAQVRAHATGRVTSLPTSER